MKPGRGYLANRMTGVPQMNFPWFDAEARRLRGEGWEIISPAELDDPEVRAAALASVDGVQVAPNGETWGDFLARDVKIIADSNLDAVLVGPEWFTSRGARLETFVAYLSGIPVLRSDTLERVKPIDLLTAWYDGLEYQRKIAA